MRGVVNGHRQGGLCAEGDNDSRRASAFTHAVAARLELNGGRRVVVGNGDRGDVVGCAQGGAHRILKLDREGFVVLVQRVVQDGDGERLGYFLRVKLECATRGCIVTVRLCRAVFGCVVYRYGVY